ncbi:MAG: SAM-dependent methyltransferase [Phycisphaerae bacterium]
MSGGLAWAIPWIESGLVPASLIRWGIRRLHQQRLDEEMDAVRAGENRLDEFVAQLESAPIALTPEKANEQHYEVPAAFFQQVLGPHLKYSSGYWAEGVTDIGVAEAAMLSLSCERAELVDGHRILELGCGWGSLTLWMAAHYPQSQIVAVSNSASQREFIYSQCKERGLNNVEVITCDMNDFSIDRTFDRVVSIEMFEHMRNLGQLLHRISTWLVPGGKLFVHIFCHRRFAYLFRSRGPADWMGNHFFTSGMMPSFDLFSRFQQDLRLEESWYENGSHYGKTSDAWFDLQVKRRREVMPILVEAYGDDAAIWFERWKIFFLACAELFHFNRGEEWGVGHYRFSRPS